MYAQELYAHRSAEHDLISSAKDNVTLRSSVTYKIRTFLTIKFLIVYKHSKNNLVNNLNCIQPLHHNDIKYQGEACHSNIVRYGRPWTATGS